MITFSLCINHTPWRSERATSIRDMWASLVRPVHFLHPLATDTLINDDDYRGTDWQVSKVAWALNQWRWAASRPCTHHIFLTDDLHIMPRFWAALSHMVAHVPDKPIGLLSNHPKGPELASQGIHWYRSNSWLVGPAYVLPHDLLVKFLAYFEALTFEQQKFANDDSSLNSWITEHGPGETYHPLPAPIEHRADLESTVGHGDRYSRERVSWREMRTVTGDPWQWKSWTCAFDVDALCTTEWWQTDAPMLTVGDT